LSVEDGKADKHWDLDYTEQIIVTISGTRLLLLPDCPCPLVAEEALRCRWRRICVQARRLSTPNASIGPIDRYALIAFRLRSTIDWRFIAYSQLATSKQTRNLAFAITGRAQHHRQDRTAIFPVAYLGFQ